MTCDPKVYSQSSNTKVELIPVEMEGIDCNGALFPTQVIGKVIIDGVVKTQDCNPKEDAQITCVSENANLYIIDWENESNTFKIYDFSGNDVTGTVTPIKCEDTEIVADKQPVCDNGVNLWEHTVYSNGVITDSYYTVMGGSTPIVPSGIVTPGACLVETIKVVTKKIDCIGATSDVDTTQTVEAVIDQTLDTTGCNDDRRDDLLVEIRDAILADTVNQTALLNTVISELQDINTNTDDVETRLQTLIDNQTNDNASIVTELQDILTEVTAINANTDSVETLITDVITAITTEGDETQVLLQQIIDKAEIDQYETSKAVYCLDGTDEVLIYDLVQFNNLTGAETSRITHYINGGVDSTTVPTGTLTQGSCPLVVSPTVIVDRTTTHARTTGNNTYSAPFRSFSITAVSNDVTLNGQLMMRGFTVSLDTPENEQHITDQVVTGTDYFVTYVI